jgi:hypothetical protein
MKTKNQKRLLAVTLMISAFTNSAWTQHACSCPTGETINKSADVACRSKTTASGGKSNRIRLSQFCLRNRWRCIRLQE